MRSALLRAVACGCVCAPHLLELAQVALGAVRAVLKLVAARWVHADGAEEALVGAREVERPPRLCQRAGRDDDLFDTRRPRALEDGVEIRLVVSRAVILALVHAIKQVCTDICTHKTPVGSLARACSEDRTHVAAQLDTGERTRSTGFGVCCMPLEGGCLQEACESLAASKRTAPLGR